MPAIVPPTDGCFAPAFTTGPGWHAAVARADISNTQLKRIRDTSTGNVQGVRRRNGFGVRRSAFGVLVLGFWGSGFWVPGSGFVGSGVVPPHEDEVRNSRQFFESSRTAALVGRGGWFLK